MVVLDDERATTNPHTHINTRITEANSVLDPQRLSDTGAAGSLAAARDREESIAEYGSSPRLDNGRVEQTQPRPTARGNTRPSKSQGQRTRATLTIGTLNMRGAGQATHGGIGEKWMQINQVLRDGRIGILGIQEAHLTDEKAEQINQLFSSSMRIYVTADPENPSGARGVAIALNKRLVDTENVEHTTLIPGRAISVKIKWSKNKNFTILAVYAPNDPNDNADFWSKMLEVMRTTNRGPPNVVLGDFNLVETAMDRMPSRPDPERPVEALKEFSHRMRIRDEWRHRYPTEVEFTYAQVATGSKSRIDRIYLDRWMQTNAVEWETRGPGIATDHQMVLCTLTNRDKPFIGKGRWRMHAVLLDDDNYLKEVKAKGLELQRELCNPEARTETRNPQTLYRTFKEGVRELAKKHAKAKVPKIAKKIDQLKKDLKVANQRAARSETNAEQRDNAIQEAAIIQERITSLEMKRFGAKRAAVAARDWLEGETISKYWSKLNKAPSTDETIYELAIPGPEPKRYAMRTDQMAAIAKDHYNGVQDDPLKPTKEEHEEAMVNILDNEMTKLTGDQKADMGKPVEYMEVQRAILEAANGKAPGIDGIPSELWKTLIRQHRTDAAKKKPAFDVIAVLRDVFQDIATHGAIPDLKFSLGWICPIYKKKDKREISNYRPITLLNADYKIFTKILANRLADVAEHLIHPDQAGFVPGR